MKKYQKGGKVPPKKMKNGGSTDSYTDYGQKSTGAPKVDFGKAKNGASLPKANYGKALAGKAGLSGSGEYKVGQSDAGHIRRVKGGKKAVGKLKGGGSMGKCKGGC